LALQVQLYAKAARDVLGQNAATGAVHLLRDNKRVSVPIDPTAIDAAVGNVEWAVNRVLAGDFPRRPAPEKCGSCDFLMLCSRQLEPFQVDDLPPSIHLPGGRTQLARAFSEVVESA
jgi:DNA helicase-2/ATP-dependent DNA helicase PcrA